MPSSSALAVTLIQVAQYHVGATKEEVGELKHIAAKLPAVPFDLTAKNKALLRQFRVRSPAREGSFFFPSN